MMISEHLRWVALVVVCVGLCAEVSAQEILKPTWKSGADSFTPELRVHLSEDKRHGFLSFEHGEQKWNSRVFGMWKVLIADLDGDGTDEVILGIWSSISRHKEPLPSRAIWVMRWDGKDLVPVWRGSAMSRPLLDFWIENTAEDASLKTLETQKDTCFDTLYTWTGFGFQAKHREPVKCLNPAMVSTPSEE